MPSVSAIVLTKNSERTIESCIKALFPAVDYVTVVDTGSTDNTVKIAQDSGVRVYHFNWQDDFSAARNFGDSLATTDWVIHVDSDEILHHEDVDKIRKSCAMYKKTTEPITISIQIINVSSEHVNVGAVARMYKRGVSAWQGIIHEQLISRRTKTLYMVESDVRFLHDGYDPRVVNTSDKYMRNIHLLKKGIEQEPDNAVYHFYLGRDYTLIGEHQSAVSHLKISVGLLEQENVHFKIRVHITLIKCLETIGDYVGAEEIASRMVTTFDNYAEGWYQARTN